MPGLLLDHFPAALSNLAQFPNLIFDGLLVGRDPNVNRCLFRPAASALQI
jgi:hypothetical protein